MNEVVTLGEAMVLFVPNRLGLLRYAQQFERTVAGAESNLAIGLARLGHRAGWISRVGNDEFGAYLVSFLRGENVDVSQVKTDAQAPTGVFFKERRRAESTRVYYYRAGSAASRLSPEDLDSTYISQAKYLHLTGITPALSESCKTTTFKAIEIASKAGVPVSFDPNLRLKLWDTNEAKRTFLEILPRVQIVLTSKEEAAFITGREHPLEAAKQMLQLGPELIVVKLGPEGALGVNKDNSVLVPGIAVQVVETVGAGDAFNAGFLSGQLRGWDLEASLKLGNIMGGLATTVPGDIEGLPDWDEVQVYLGGEGLVER